MHEYVYNVPWWIEIILPDGSCRYNILNNVYVYNIFVKIGDNENNA